MCGLLQYIRYHTHLVTSCQCYFLNIFCSNSDSCSNNIYNEIHPNTFPMNVALFCYLKTTHVIADLQYYLSETLTYVQWLSQILPKNIYIDINFLFTKQNWKTHFHWIYQWYLWLAVFSYQHLHIEKLVSSKLGLNLCLWLVSQKSGTSICNLGISHSLHRWYVIKKLVINYTDRGFGLSSKKKKM